MTFSEAEVARYVYGSVSYTAKTNKYLQYLLDAGTDNTAIKPLFDWLKGGKYVLHTLSLNAVLHRTNATTEVLTSIVVCADKKSIDVITQSFHKHIDSKLIEQAKKVLLTSKDDQKIVIAKFVITGKFESINFYSIAYIVDLIRYDKLTDILEITREILT